MESTPPSPQNAKPQARTAATPGIKRIAGVPARRYPKPPPFIQRFIMLCVRPETWAEAARYPGWVTLLPLLIALIVASLITAGAASFRLQGALHEFAASYDTAGNPPLEYHSDGTLSTNGPLANPIRLELPQDSFIPESVLALLDPRGIMPERLLILIDPSGKSAPDTFKSRTLFITDSQVMATSEDGAVPVMKLTTFHLFRPFDEAMAPNTVKIINTSSLLAYLHAHRVEMTFSSMISAVLVFLMESLWAAAMIYLISPLVMLAASGGHITAAARERRLLLPRAAAARMVAAFLVPMVLVNAILHASGHSTTSVLGAEGSLLFWFLACGGVAVWTGLLAKHLFMPKEPVRQSK